MYTACSSTVQVCTNIIGLGCELKSDQDYEIKLHSFIQTHWNIASKTFLGQTDTFINKRNS